MKYVVIDTETTGVPNWKLPADAPGQPRLAQLGMLVLDTIDAMLHVTVEETPLALCHYAMRVWALSHYGALHLYGHSHGSLPGDSQSLDVGVDCWDFRPVSLEEIRDRLATFAPRSEPDHHVRPGGRA